MIIIKKAIMHILNNKEDEKVLAEFELTLNDKIINLINKHITTSQRHDYRKIAEFSSNNNVVSSSCEEIFSNNDSFIEESKNIANQLFDSMRGTASPANFIVCLYEEDQIQWIALLKMDFNENYRPIITEVDGKNKVDIEIIEGTLPNKKQKLQKCVFIPNKIYEDQTENNDIFILDKQSGDEVSDYFKIDFLHCNLKNSSRDNTRMFVTELLSIIQEEYSNDQSREKDIIDQMWKLLLEKKGKTICVPEFVSTLFNEEDTEEEIDTESIMEKLSLRSFDFEFIGFEKYINVRAGRRKIETGIGITLFGDNSAFMRDNFCISEENSDGNVDITLKNVTIKEKLS